jgi:hypothetical protein
MPPTPAMHTYSCLRSESPALPTPAKPKLYMPQVAFQLLPVLQEGERLEIEENENEVNDDVTIHIIYGQDSWTSVQRQKKKMMKVKNSKEKILSSLVTYGIRSPMRTARQPMSHMPLQQHVQLSALQPSLLPTLTTAVAPSLPLILLIVVTPPTCQATPEGQKHHRLEAIPEEEELPEP